MVGEEGEAGVEVGVEDEAEGVDRSHVGIEAGSGIVYRLGRVVGVG